jgi:hypothetical protein
MPLDVNTDQQTKAQIRPTNCHNPGSSWKKIQLSLTSQDQTPVGTDEEEWHHTWSWYLVVTKLPGSHFACAIVFYSPTCI